MDEVRVGKVEQKLSMTRCQTSSKTVKSLVMLCKEARVHIKACRVRGLHYPPNRSRELQPIGANAKL